MWAHQAAWDAEPSVLLSKGEICGWLKIRGWSSGGGLTMCALGMKGGTVGESLHPGGENMWFGGEAEKIAEVLWEVLRSWFALRTLTQIGSLTQIGLPLSFA